MTDVRNRRENVQLHKDYTVVCVWPAMILGEGQEQKMVDRFKTEFDTRIQFLEVIFTEPDPQDSNPDAGGRSDIFFAIHKEDVGKFVIPKLQIRARWLCDVLAKCNYSSPIYPNRVFDYPH